MTKVVLVMRIGFKPSAECNIEGCTWTHPASQYTRQRAKDHVRTAGHAVLIKTETLEEWEPHD